MVPEGPPLRKVHFPTFGKTKFKGSFLSSGSSWEMFHTIGPYWVNIPPRKISSKTIWNMTFNTFNHSQTWYFRKYVLYLRGKMIYHLSTLLKTIYYKVDLKISNNPKICRFLPTFFVNKTDQILFQFQLFVIYYVLD